MISRGAVIYAIRLDSKLSCTGKYFTFHKIYLGDYFLSGILNRLFRSQPA